MVASKSKNSAKSAKPVSRAKTKKVTKSANLHASKTRAKSSRLAKSKTFSKKSFHISRRVAISVVALAMLIVVLSVFFSHITSPETQVKRKIEEISADYYENYYYDRLASYATEAKPLEDSLAHYAEKGFNKTTLRQLLLFDGERNSAAAPTLTHYCDENETYIKIYPVAPYGKKDYRIEYNYSCVF